MNRSAVDLFEKLVVQLDGLHQEISVMAKKSPNDAVNVFKLRLINAIISDCNALFGEKYRPFSDFEMFSSDDVPSNSDVSFVVAQYIECAEKFRSDNVVMRSGWWYWDVESKELDDDDKIRTSAPKKIKDR